MNTFLIVYAVLGALFTIIEHYSYDWDFNGMSGFKITLNILHQLIHYSRCMIVWPWYLIEDALIILDNKYLDDDDDSDDKGTPA